MNGMNGMNGLTGTGLSMAEQAHCLPHIVPELSCVVRGVAHRRCDMLPEPGAEPVCIARCALLVDLQE